MIIVSESRVPSRSLISNGGIQKKFSTENASKDFIKAMIESYRIQKLQSSEQVTKLGFQLRDSIQID